ncbi:hypothetical protein HDC37_003302 [Microbacterium sp. AK009]|uniref:DUF6153 family protein n=1 Tax=Microbacterium sp. AK009 TaxID=2723068 RepID=UPI0015CCD280|nr:DUF6153 family protein [Microbacterium sp. AK009]NYF18438.1 hypothetical protein [Microbacterium sp. AK009]
MSLITLTDRLHAGRSIARTLLLLIALTAAVIVGLLAMHSLNTHTAAQTGHQATVATASVTVDDHHSGATVTDEGCADCGSGHADMLAMACVLALLASVLLLARLRPSQVWLSVLPRPRPLSAALPGRPRLRPPSLTALCISRT